MRVTLFIEHNPSMDSPEGKAAYPNGIGACLKQFIEKDGHTVTALTYDDKDCGSALTDEILDSTDVLVWWGHWYHGAVEERIIAKTATLVGGGMGLVVLHSGHESKIMQRLLGTSCSLYWREAHEKERVWIIEPSHPVAKGLPDNFLIPHEEMYGEQFNIPAPDELVMLGWFEGGNVMRSCCVFNRGRGKLLFFQPGHETNPTYHIPEVQSVIKNAVNYVSPKAEIIKTEIKSFHQDPALEKIGE